MNRNLPPLNPLRVFDVAARHRHFTRAAEELGVSQAAVSKQVAVLEQWLGFELFERSRAGLILTDAGARYWASIRSPLSEIERSTAAAMGEPSTTRIVVCSYTTFALFWLLPRLSQLRRAQQDLRLQVLTSTAATEIPVSDADVVIRHGTIPAAGVPLFCDVLVPVCSPGLLIDGRGVKTAADLKAYPMLQSRHRKRDWDDWYASVGEEPDGAEALVFDGSSLAYQAAKEGMGVAMGQLDLLRSELASGALVVPYDKPLKCRSGYFFLRTQRADHAAAVSPFCAWLESEAGRQDANRTDALTLSA